MKARHSEVSENSDWAVEQQLAATIFDELANQTRDEAGISRPAYSAIETQALQYLAGFASAQGLEASYDAGQNGNYTLPGCGGARPYCLVGSHIDSVPQGGNFDGLAGVIAGLLCLTRARRENKPFPRPVRVIALRGEESAWFGPCYIGSRALLGLLSETERLSPHRGDGEPLDAHMQRSGVAMAHVRDNQPLLDPAHVSSYLELHIEQGPLLIEKNLPMAVVSGIRGNFRHPGVRCRGVPGHSGAVPRAYRRDAVLAMAELLSRLDDQWDAILQHGHDLVLTAGMVATDTRTHAMSRIPDIVDFSLDIRSQSKETLDRMRSLLNAEIDSVQRKRGVCFVLGPEHRSSPVSCDVTIRGQLEAAMAGEGLEPFTMASGGGHDAASFVEAGIPVGMVFVRNRNGSHNPNEEMALDDFMIAVGVLYRHLMEGEG